jgi:hypothetical protein
MSLRRPKPEVACATRKEANGIETVLFGNLGWTSRKDDKSVRNDTSLLAIAPPFQTSACVPRRIDPDYCAWDGFYGIGLTVTASLTTALLALPVVNVTGTVLVNKIARALLKSCEFQDSSWMGYLFGDYRTVYYPTLDPPFENERINRSFLCDLLVAIAKDSGEVNTMNMVIIKPLLDLPGDNAPGLVFAALSIATQIASLVLAIVSPAVRLSLGKDSAGTITGSALFGSAVFFSAKKGLRMLSYYTRELSRGIASYLRVNAIRLRKKEDVMGVRTFMDMIKADIKDGIDEAPKPAPPPASKNKTSEDVEVTQATLRIKSAMNEARVLGIDACAFD